MQSIQAEHFFLGIERNLRKSRAEVCYIGAGTTAVDLGHYCESF